MAGAEGALVSGAWPFTVPEASDWRVKIAGPLTVEQAALLTSLEPHFAWSIKRTDDGFELELRSHAAAAFWRGRGDAP